MAPPGNEEDSGPPSELLKALSLTPLTHLIPKQDMFPMIASLDVTPVAVLREEGRDLGTNGAGICTPAGANGARGENGKPAALLPEESSLLEKFHQFESPLVRELFEQRPAKDVDASLESEELTVFENNLVKHNAFSYELKRRPLPVAKPHIYTPSELKKMPEKEFQRLLFETAKPIEKSRQKRELEQPVHNLKSKRLHSTTSADYVRELTQLVDSLSSTEETTGPNWHPKGGIMILTVPALTSLSDSITRAAPTLESSDTDSLLQIQRWCNTAVLYGCSVDWNNFGDQIESEKQHFVVARLETATASLLAAKVILVLLTSSRRDAKPLHIEEPLIAVVDFILRFATAVRLVASSNLPIHKLRITRCVAQLSAVIAATTTYIRSNDINDTMVTRLEYLCMSFIFYEAPKGANAVSAEAIEGLKLDLCSLISAISKRYPDQRLFILNEIFNNMSKLLLARSRTVKVGRGVSVQLHTALLINLLQSVGEEQSERLAKFDTERKWSAETLESILHTAASITRETNLVAVKAIDGLLSSSYGASVTSKQVLQSLIEDLLAIVACAECPGAVVYIECLFSTFGNIVQKALMDPSNTATQQESFAFDMIGLIGEKLLSLNEQKSRNHSTSNFEALDTLQGSAEAALGRIQSLKSKNPDLQDAFAFLALQFLSSLETFVEDLDDSGSLKSLDPSTLRPLQHLVRYLLTAFNSGSVAQRNSLPAGFPVLLFRAQGGHKFLLDNFLILTVEALASNKIKFQSRAMKIVAFLVAKNGSVLLHPKIQKALSQTLFDGSALVRDASIDLVTKYLISNSSVTLSFYRVLCDMLNDDSVSVRKRVVRFARVMYDSTAERHIKVHITTRMLEALTDEDDSVVESARDFFDEVWLKPEENAAVLATAEVMMDVAVLKELALQLWLQRVDLSEPAMYRVAEALLGFVIDSVGTRFQNDVDKALYLIALLTLHTHRLLNQSQLLSLVPLLQDESTPAASALLVMRVFRRGIPALPALSPNFVSVVEPLMLGKFTRCGFEELQELVPCVWALCVKTDTFSKVGNALVSCVRMLMPLMKHRSEGDKVSVAKQVRLVDLLGAFGAHCDFEALRDHLYKAQIGLQEKETVASLILRYLLFFCEADVSEHVQLASARGLILVCSRHPSLFVSPLVLLVLDGFLESDPPAQNVVLDGLRRFLGSERLNDSSDKKKKKPKFGSTSVADGIPGSIAQRFTPVALRLCLEGPTRQDAFQLVREIMVAGLANPKVCIPTVIALEASDNIQLAGEASMLHTHMLEHHESMVNSSYPESIKLAHQVNDQSTSFLQLLLETVSQSAVSRMKLMAVLPKTLRVQLRLSGADLLEQLQMVRFALANISHVKFESLQEIMVLIAAIERELSREGMDLAEQLEDDMDGLSEEQVSGLFCTTEALSAMLHFRDYLCDKHEISRTQIEGFNPRRVDPDFRKTPQVKDAVFSYRWQPENPTREQMKVVFLRFVREMDEFS